MISLTNISGIPGENYTVRIMNLLGQEIYRDEFVSGTVIDVSGIHPKGLFFIDVITETGDERVVRKVVLE